MQFVIVIVLSIFATAAWGCEPLPDGQECPPDGLHLYVDEEHCSRYWECYNGCGTHMLCQKDYLYLPDLKWCEEPQKVFCGDRDCDGRPCLDQPPSSTVSPPTVSTQPPYNGTFQCPSDGYFPDPNNCIKYFHCFNGEVEQHVTCHKAGSSGTEQLCYEANTIQCDYCDTVPCGSRPICDENDENCVIQPEITTRPPNRCDAIDCDADGFVALGACDQCFCECSAGHSYQFCCEPGLFFNKAEDVCDWPYNIPACP